MVCWRTFEILDFPALEMPLSKMMVELEAVAGGYTRQLLTWVATC